MSVEDLKEYAQRCEREPELRKKARAIGVENIDEHIRISASMGLDWDWSDMKALQKEMVGAAEDIEDLSEQELEMVAGGAFSVTLVASLAVGAGVGAAAGGAVAGAAVAGTAASGKGGW